MFKLILLSMIVSWDLIMHVLAGGYKVLFFIVQYEYEGLFDTQYRKELSWEKKIFCLEEYADEEMLNGLRNIEQIKGKKELSNRDGKITEEFFFLGRHLIVKSAEVKGFVSNLVCMGLGVDIWNNAYWMKKKGIPVVKPMALVEKRCWNRTKSFVVYLYEGDVCEKEMQKRDDFFPKIQELEGLLYRNNVIHNDFRLRNIVVLEDRAIQFIDIDKAHIFPRNSVVFRKRMERDVRKFNINMAKMTGSDKRLEV